MEKLIAEQGGQTRDGGQWGSRMYVTVIDVSTRTSKPAYRMGLAQSRGWFTTERPLDFVRIPEIELSGRMPGFTTAKVGL